MSNESREIPAFEPLPFGSVKELYEDIVQNREHYRFVRRSSDSGDPGSEPLTKVWMDRKLLWAKDKWSMNGDIFDANGRFVESIYLVDLRRLKKPVTELYLDLDAMLQDLLVEVGMMDSDLPGIREPEKVTPAEFMYEIKPSAPLGILSVSNPDKKQIWGA